MWASRRGRIGQHGKESCRELMSIGRGRLRWKNLQVVFLSSADSLKEESGTIFGSQIKVFQTFLYSSCCVTRFPYSTTFLMNFSKLASLFSEMRLVKELHGEKLQWIVRHSGRTIDDNTCFPSERVCEHHRPFFAYTAQKSFDTFRVI